MTSILLEAPGLDPLDIGLGNGYIIRRLDLGDAQIREVVADAPDADGTIDTSQLLGARVITLGVRIVPRNGFIPAVQEQRLRSFTGPRIRPTMTVQRDGLPAQRLTLRRGPFSAPIEKPTFSDITVQWVAPLGIIESAEQHVQDVFAAGSGATVGRTYSLTFSRSYPASAPLGSAVIANEGTSDAYPLIRLYGPFTDPVLDNTSQGKSLTFAGLTLTAGQFLEINTRTKTIFANGDPTTPLYDKLAFPTSKWWTLSPGSNSVRFHPATFTEGVTRAELTWRDAYL